MRLAVLFDRLNPVVDEALRRVSTGGVEVERLSLGQEPRERPDLAYLKTSAEPALRLAASLHARGVATLNPYATVARLVDKLEAVRALREAGLPAPESWGEASAALAAGGPWIVKPRRGSRGRGVRVVREPEEVVRALSGAEAYMVQRFVSGDGRDHKLYVMGDRVLGVERRPAPSGVYASWDEKAAAGAPFEPSSSLGELARRCGAVLGLRLFGLDVLLSGGAAFVVDVNKCPGFVGVSGGARSLAEVLVRETRASRGA